MSTFALVASGTLALVGVAALAWAFIMRQRWRAAQQTPPPQPNLFSPLFRALAGTFDVGIVVVDQERQVRYINPLAARLLNVVEDTPFGGLITILRDYQADNLVTDVLRDGEPREMVLQPLVSGPTLRLRTMPLVSEELTGAVLIVRDVTQLSMLERARRDMVANVSHELRTPLASVKLLVETLQSSPPEHIAQRMLVQMAQEVDAITQLVDELHELSQIESGRVALQLAPNDLESVAGRALERIRPQAERKQIGINLDVPEDLPPALIDANRIGQVLLNLLHNAVKFTSEGGQIGIRVTTITVEATDRGSTYEEHGVHEAASGRAAQQRRMPSGHRAGEWMLVMVKDSGIGIPSRDLPRIFERFYKVDRARTRNAGGTGLGLAIAKHLVEGHGGRIWATSQEGSGSTFLFTVPLV